MLRGLSVILVRPRFPENIGMAARAMANMGAEELVLVQPEMWHKEKAAPLATAQGLDILEACRVEESLEAVLRPFVAAFGTTARTGGWRREVLSPEAAATQIRSLLREEWADPVDGEEAGQAPVSGRDGCSGNRVALVFGSEDCGLLNAEIELCTRLVHVPTAIGNSSLNLAQAVLLLLYECMKADMALPVPAGKKRQREWTKPAGKANSRRATLEEEALLMRTLEETLVDIGHLPGDNSGWFMQPLRRFLRKSDLRRHELDMIMGICRKMRRISSMNNNSF